MIGLSRADHAVAGGDGARGGGDGAGGLRAAAADRRRHHVAGPHRGQDRAPLPRPVVHVLDASRAVGVVGNLLSESAPGRVRRTIARRVRRASARRARAAAGRRSGRPSRSAEARGQPRWPSTGRPIARPGRASWASGAWTTIRWRSWSTGSTGRRSSRPGSCTGAIPAILDDPEWGERRAALRGCRAHAASGSWTSGLLRARAVVGFFPANSGGRRHRAVRRRVALGPCSRVIHTLRQQMAKRGRPAEHGAGGLRRPARRPACADYFGAFAVTAGHGLDRAGRPLRGAPRRLQCDPGQGPRRPAGGGVRGAAARAGAARAVGLRAATNALNNDGADQGGVPGHPARPPAIPPAPTTPRSGRCSICSGREPTPASR